MTPAKILFLNTVIFMGDWGLGRPHGFWGPRFNPLQMVSLDPRVCSVRGQEGETPPLPPPRTRVEERTRGVPRPTLQKALCTDPPERTAWAADGQTDGQTRLLGSEADGEAAAQQTPAGRDVWAQGAPHPRVPGTGHIPCGDRDRDEQSRTAGRPTLPCPPFCRLNNGAPAPSPAPGFPAGGPGRRWRTQPAPSLPFAPRTVVTSQGRA